MKGFGFGFSHSLIKEIEGDGSDYEPVPDSLFFDGSSRAVNYGNVGDSEIFNANPGDTSLNQFSLRFIGQMDKDSSDMCFWSKYTTPSNRTILWWRRSTGVIRIICSPVGSGTNQITLETTDTFEDFLYTDAWFSFDNSLTGISKFKLHWRNEEIALTLVGGTIPSDFTFSTTSAPLKVGAYNGSSFPFQGRVNQFGIVNVAITPAQRSAAWNGGKPKPLNEVFETSQIVINSHGGTWNGSEYDVPDHSGNGFDAVTENFQEHGLNKKTSPYFKRLMVIVSVGNQSNPGGRIPMGSIPPSQAGVHDGFYVFRDSAVEWNRISSTGNNNQYGQPTNQYGFKFKMMEDLRPALPFTPYLYFRYFGGSAITTVADGGDNDNWNPDTVDGVPGPNVTALFQRVAEDLVPFMQYCIDRDLIPWILGNIRQQGEAEANAGTQNPADIYLTNINYLSSSLFALFDSVAQSMLSASDYAVYSQNVKLWMETRINRDFARPYNTIVTGFQEDFVNADLTNRRLIDGDSTDILIDGHYDATGNETMGARWAAAIIADFGNLFP